MAKCDCGLLGYTFSHSFGNTRKPLIFLAFLYICYSVTENI